MSIFRFVGLNAPSASPTPAQKEETMSVLLERARESAECPPSLLSVALTQMDHHGFDAAMLQLLDTKGFSLQADERIVPAFISLVEMSSSVEKIPGELPLDVKMKILVFRRCILLSAVGRTPIDSPSLKRIVASGFLTAVKSWLDQVLRAPDGMVDFLLHMLSNIIHLPVTKSTIKDSGLGKAIGSIEKQSFCKGTPNEAAIVDRVQKVKSAWSAVVKSQKTAAPKVAPKRAAAPTPAPVAKKAKPSNSVKTNSFSSLLKKVAGPSSASAVAATNHAIGASAVAAKLAAANKSLEASKQATAASTAQPKKSSNRVKWMDHFGGDLSVFQLVEGRETSTTEPTANISWTDRKQRDRMREKELLANAKKSKLVDDDEDDFATPMIRPTRPWQSPSPLPDRPDVAKAELSSTELQTQSDRARSVPRAKYSSEHDVPMSPAPLTDVEQAMDMTAQSSAVVATIPFFVPHQNSPVPDSGTAPIFSDPSAALSVPGAYPVPAPSSVATPEFVQSLGLPPFLVGQSTQALQTLAASPGLLTAMVDANGMYDQVRLMSLVQTLSSSPSAGPPPSAPSNQYQPPPPSSGGFGGPPSANQHMFPGPTGFRSNSDDGNLHVVGFGPSTTEADIIAAFSPYVRVDEVVMKGTFCFVNTSDPMNARRAKESLAGTLIGGMPIRINDATRKSKEVGQGRPFHGGPPAGGFGGPPNPPPQQNAPGPMRASNGPNQDVSHVRDDRGNPATKNLFVAGYGPGTSEQQLRDHFSQYAQVTGVVSKGSFSFVNTGDRPSAVHVREILSGTMLNGGVLRINFAKETGRLGTSFDLTYGPNTGPNAPRHQNPGPPANNYYGRGF